MKQLFIISSCLLASSALFAQTGPGGVGSVSNNTFWLDASDLSVVSDGTTISPWTDRSGNGNDVSANATPSYQSNVFNGRPAIRFRNGDRYNFGDLTSYTAGEVFAVIEALADPPDNGDDAELWDFGSTGNRGLYPNTDGNLFEEFGTNNRKNGISVPALNRPRIYNVRSASGDYEIRLDGSSLFSSGTNTVAFENAAVLGREENGGGFDGDIAEFILFDEALNAAQEIIIDNYLSSKYDIDISGDFYNLDTTHPNEVAGIGQSAGESHTAAYSGGILGFSGADDLDNDEFLFLGHDGGSLASWNTNELPSGFSNLQRLTREWRVDETGDVGNINVDLLTSQLPALPTAYTDYYLLVDTDGDFTSGATFYLFNPSQTSAFNIQDGAYMTIAVVRPEVSFSAAASQELESAGAVNIQLDLNYAISGAVSIPFSTGGTAVEGAIPANDYLLGSSSPLTISAGATSTNISLTLGDDATEEDGSETATFTMGSITGAEEGDIGVHTLTIEDNDNATRDIEFTSTSNSVSEASVTENIAIDINLADGSTATTVNVVVIGGTATEGIDFQLPSSTATIPAGAGTSVNFEVDVFEDALNEADETIILQLTSPTNAQLGTNTQFTLTISNDDATVPTVEFVQTTVNGGEAGGTTNVQVELSGVSGQDVSVPFSITDISATQNTDYVISTSPITIPAGTTSANISVSVLEDALEEGGETFTITLTGSNLGTNTVTTFTIGDNDQSGFTGPGGVGDNETNLYWLRADSLTGFANGATIGTWNDVSGNNNDITSNATPSYEASSNFNGRPAVSFENGDRFQLGDLTSLTEGEVFAVIEADADPPGNGDDAELWDFGSTGDRGLYPNTDGNLFEEFGTTTRKNGITAPALNQPRIYNVRSGASDYEIRLDGSSLFSTSTNTVGFENAAVIGREENGGGFDGDIAEFILFNQRLNAAQRIIVDNYLAAKYDITVATDVYGFQSAHGNDVSGIGQTGGVGHFGARSAGILSVSSASNLGDDEYLLFGHDGGSIATWTTTETPNGGVDIERLPIEWRVDETGDVGTVTVGLDISTLPAANSGFTNYLLLIDADGNFSAGATEIPLSNVGGSNYEASGVDITDQSFLAIAVIRPTVSFELASSDQFEPNSPAVVNVDLNFPLASDVSVTYTVDESGTSGVGQDVSFSAGTLAITAGNTRGVLNVTIINDGIAESQEQVVITLDTPSAGLNLGSTTSHTFNINDDDAPVTVAISSVSSSGDEATSPVTITVTRTGTVTADISVDYAITGGTATAGIDASVSGSGTLTIPSTQTTGTFDLVVSQDALREDNETVEISLSNPSGVAETVNLDLANSSLTYTINDDDADPTVAFSSATASGSESSGLGTFEVQLSSVSGEDVTVGFTVGSGTATAGGVDFTLSDGTVIIPAGSLTADITVLITEDTELEGGETIIVDLDAGTTVNATLGATQSATMTVADNDNLGLSGPGGVGDNETNLYWLRADSLTGFANGATIGTWNDVSGNNNDITSNATPSYEASSNFNGRPAVSFENGDRFQLGDLTSLTEGEVFAVIEADADPPGNGDDAELWDFGSTGDRGLYPNTDGNLFEEFGTTTRKNGITAPALNQPRIYNVRSGASDYEIRLDGSSLFSTSTNTVGFENAAVIGREENGGGFDGDIAEFILFNQRLNAAQRIIVDNYLAAKYDITVATDVYGFQSAHGNDVSGIGQTGGVGHFGARSAGILSVSSASNLGDDEYLLFGHDGGSIATWTTTETPNGGVDIERLPIEWRVDETGDVGTVTVGLDISTLPAANSGFTNYLLLIDADGNFSAGATEIPLSNVGGSNYEASGVDITDQSFLAIAVIRPTVSFELASSDQFEPNSPAVVNVDLNFPLASDVSVTYTVDESGTSGVGQDVSFSAGTLAITAGNTRGVLNVTIINDGIAESQEQVVITLDTPSAGLNLGSTTSHTFNINDDDAPVTVAISSVSSSGDEATSPVTITVTRTGTVTADISVDYAITGGTATAGIDASVSGSGTLTIPSTQTTGTFDLVVSQDALREDNETVEISLSNPSGVAETVNLDLANSSLTYTIDDDDADPTVAFSSATASGSESSGLGTFEVQLSSVSGEDVTVGFTVGSGTATAGGVDFTLSDGTVIIPAGSLTADITVLITEDTELEGGETIIVDLDAGTTVNATLGATQSATMTVADNDNVGAVGPGGVGDDETNLFWLRADSLSFTDGQTVSVWNDVSGNNNDVSSNATPAYEASSNFNGRPAVSFENGDRFQLGDLTSLTEGEVFAVIEADADPPGNGDDAELWDFGSTGDRGLYPNTDGNLFEEFGTTTRKNGITAPALNQPRIYNVRSGASDYEIRLDGSSLFSTSTNTVGFENAAVIGREENGGGFDGDIAEFILFNQRLNAAQRIIVENYLAAKYAISIANDLYSFQTSYGNDVSGIGQESASVSHFSAQSAGVLTFNSASDLGDNEYFFFGHDGSSISSWTTTDAPNGGVDFQRLQIEWRVDETGDIGTVTAQLDTALLSDPGAQFTTYVLLVDADGTFASDAEIYTLTNIGGSVFEATGVDINDQSFITIGVIRPTVQFTLAETDQFEPNSPAAIQVDLNFAFSEDITVDYTVNDNGNAADISFPSGTLTITAGNTSSFLSATIVNDAISESEETISITLSNPTTGLNLGTITSHDLKINDDDNARQISFTAGTLTVSEGVGTVDLTIQSNLAAPAGNITFDYAITGGSGTSGVDATIGTDPLFIREGQMDTILTVTINEDALREADETIEISLSNPTNANLALSNSTIEIEITDNDNDPQVQFSSATNSGSEASGFGEIEVQLDVLSGQDITVGYTVTPISATAGGIDFTLPSPGTVVIPAGAQTADIFVLVSEDLAVEGGETFTVTLDAGTTVGADLNGSGILTTTFNISDNDNIGAVGPGGIGDNSVMQYWLRADSITGVAEGATVGSWPDISGNNNDVSSNNTPAYISSVTNFNGKPAVRFENGDRFDLGNLTSLTSGEVFAVIEADADPPGNGDDAELWDLGSTGNRGLYPNTDGNLFEEFGTTVRKGNISVGPLNQTRVYNVRSATGEYEITLDGSSIFSTATNTVGFENAAILGREENGGGFDGDIAEFILFNQTLNAAQRSIVINYLAAKYDVNISNDLYLFQDNYGEAVSGIGRVDASSIHSAAESAGVLQISSPSDLNNDEYVLFGHNGGAITWTTTEAPNAGDNIQRLPIEWRFDETGDVGTIAFTLDTTLLQDPGAGYSNYVLLTDLDGDFSSGATTINLSRVAGTSTFEALGIDVPDQQWVTVGVVRPEVEFTADFIQRSEINSPAVITATLNFPLAFDVTVNYNVAGNGSNPATQASDFNFPAGSFTITAGNTSRNLNVTIINDSEVESDETLGVEITSITGGLVNIGTNDSTTVRINDDDNPRKVDFNVTSASGAESVTPVTVQVDITSASSNPTTVDYTVTGGTATGGGPDFTLADGTVTIPGDDTSTSGTFDIVINQDALDEADETIVIQLTNPTNSSLNSTDIEFTYTIEDDDDAPTVSFSNTSFSASEVAGTGEMEVSLSSVSGQDVEVSYTVTAGTATGGGTDFSLADGTLTIPSGSLNADILVVVVDDAILEGSEDFSVELTAVLGTPAPATLTTPTTATFTISDNDNIGSEGPGGVGDSDITRFWLRADSLPVVANGTTVGTWNDVSGSNNDVASNNTPAYRANVANFNGQPVVRFENGDRFGLGNLSALTEGEVFVVVEADADPPGNGDDAELWDLGSTGDRGQYPATDGNLFEEFGSADRKGNIAVGPLDQVRVYNVRSATNDYEIRLDGESIFTDATHTVGFENAAILGREENGGGFDGDIAEFIFFDQALNTTQRNIVDNYLAAKYGVTLPSNDLYGGEANNYFDVSGIGQEGTLDFHSAAQSAGILTISSASDLDDGEYLFFGHDNNGVSAWNTTESTGTDTRRLGLEWFVDQSGGDGVGTVSVEVDATVLPAEPLGFTNYVLLQDTDGDFSDGATVTELTNTSGNLYSANGISLTDGSFITIGVRRRTIQFSLAVSQTREPEGPASIAVELSSASASDVTVDYSITGGTATNGGVDYLLATSGTLTITAGNTTTSLSIPLIDDAIIESSESVILGLTGPSAGVGLGTNATHTFNISDDDNSREIQFQAVTGSGSEGTTPASITVEINEENLAAPTTVDYTITGGSATGGGVDYTLADGTATIAQGAGNLSTTIDLDVVDDAIFEGDETIEISLSAATAANLGTNQEFTFTITDNETTPLIDFSASSFLANEGDGTATVNIFLNQVSATDVSVDYATSDGTALAGGDYTTSSGTATITAGNSSVDVSIPLTNDSDSEVNETFTVTLSNPVGASISGVPNNPVAVLISDDDNIGVDGPGGVGEAANNVLWLRADDIGQADATSVTSWSDASGNANTFTNGTNSPTYNTAVQNGLPVVTFDGNDAMTGPSTITGIGGRTIFIAGSVASSLSTSTFLELNNGRGGGTGASYRIRGDVSVDVNSGDRLFSSGLTLSTFSVLTVSNAGSSDVDAVSAFLGGTALTQSSATSATINTSTGGTVLGGTSGSAGELDGQVGEVIVYNVELNGAQRTLVENYLAERWGASVTPDLFDSQGGTYDNGIVGVGQEDPTNFHLLTESDGILTIDNLVGVDNGEYLLTGHDDGGTTGSWVTSNVPSMGIQRLSQIWYFDETGGINTATLTIDGSAFPASPGSNFTTYVLLFDNVDDDFTSGTQVLPLTDLGSNTFQLDGFVVEDGFLSIGIAQNLSNAGGANADFNDTANWLSGFVPGAGETAIVASGNSMRLTADVTLSSLTLEDATASLDLNGMVLTLDTDCITLNGGSIDASTAGSTIVYSNASDQCVTGSQSGLLTYNDLTLGGGGTKTLQGDIEIDGDLVINSGVTLDVNTSNAILISGDWNNSGSFTEGTGTVTLDGGTDQSITAPGSETFYNLVINKSSGTADIQQQVDIDNQLTLTNGLVSVGSEQIIIGTTATISGGDADSYVLAESSGTLNKLYSDGSGAVSAFNFPIGDSEGYTPISFTLNSGTRSSAAVSGRISDNVHPGIDSAEHLSQYWVLQSTGITNPDYNISFIYSDVDVVESDDDFIPIKFNTFADTSTFSNFAFNDAANTLSWSNLTSFSDITAQGSNDTTTPVELLSFTAEENGGRVILRWQTATELNNELFELQRSTDGRNFEYLGRVNGNGTTNDISYYSFTDFDPLVGVNYYRFKQVDFDGAFEFSPIVFVDYEPFGNVFEAKIFPNPISGNDININLETGNLTQPVYVQLIDLTGRTVYNEWLQIDEPISDHQLTVPEIKSGTYLLTMSQQGSDPIMRRLIVRD